MCRIEKYLYVSMLKSDSIGNLKISDFVKIFCFHEIFLTSIAFRVYLSI